MKRILFQIAKRMIFFAGCFLFSSNIMAAVTIGAIKGNVTGAIGDLMTILQDVGMIAGVGFVIASFFKFHQHKMQPTQVPLSQGITLLLVGAGLTVFPSLLGTVSKSAFGASAGTGSISSFIKS